MAAAPRLIRFRIVLWALVVVAAIGATGLFFWQQSNGQLADGPIGQKPFTLNSTKGGTFTEADLKGTPSLVFFGYTFCPDVCPTTLADIATWKQKLGLKAEQLRTIFVTVDPGRDTQQVLSGYLGNFDADAIGLVGDATQTTAAKASFGVFSENQPPDKNGNYLVNHTADVFLMDKDGKFQGTIDYGEDDAAALAKIKRLVAG
ncbi:MAG TPA: SCO family protein [Devosia sp.]|nr:SCO family protein [Devosia sp.]